MRHFHGYAFIAALPALALLGACTKNSPSPEQACSAPETYDQLTQIIAMQVAQGGTSNATDPAFAAASSKSAIGRVLKFTLPTVSEINAGTKKVSCNAVLSVTTPSGAAALIPAGSLTVNEVAVNHVDFQISYSVQPTADEGRNLFTLENASDIGVAALEASILSVQQMQKAAGISPNLPTPDAEVDQPNEADIDTSTSPTTNLLNDPAAGSEEADTSNAQ